jgi:Meiotically Up-regulated Gene 113 (MUG113) protein
MALYTHGMSKDGYVYVREGVWRGDPLYKIGHSKDPAGRARDVRPPFPTELTINIYSEDRRWGERRLHEHFAEKKIYAEWFALDFWDLQFLMRLEEEIWGHVRRCKRQHGPRRGGRGGDLN